MSADFLLELLSEEVPARMQAKARNDLARMMAEALAAAGLTHDGITTYSTPRRLALIARGLPLETAAVSEELKGPKTAAPQQALDGFLRKTGLTRDQLEDRDGIWFAVIDRPGRATAAVLADAVATIVRDFQWPKSMRWGAASASTASLRWVRPLHSIVALLGEQIVDVQIDGVTCGATTLGHRFHHPGPITIGGAHDYVEKLRACHVLVDQEERETIIRDRSAQQAKDAGFALVEDEGLVVENAGLTEWPVPLLGSFDPDYLDVPQEVIQLTARTNQKYFVMRGGEGALAPHFVCTANIDANDGGAAIVAGNERVLAARLSDARFFWDQDLKIPLEEQAKKLEQIVFHEKLGTVADKVERVAKLARWLVEEGIIKPSPLWGGKGGGPAASAAEETLPAEKTLSAADAAGPPPQSSPTRGKEVAELATLAERAARLAKADLVTGMVGEFPELQGLIGGHLARAQGEPDAIADAIRDHYKPVGQGDDVPTAPVTVAVSLADKLDTIVSFFGIDERPTGSKDPFAVRRSALGVVGLILGNQLRLPLFVICSNALAGLVETAFALTEKLTSDAKQQEAALRDFQKVMEAGLGSSEAVHIELPMLTAIESENSVAMQLLQLLRTKFAQGPEAFISEIANFFADRLKVQQREAGVRHDLIDAVFALGGEDDLVRLLARVKALQAFVETGEGANLLAGYKRAANILKKEGWSSAPAQAGALEGGVPTSPGLRPSPEHSEPVEIALADALDTAGPTATAAVEAEDFTAAMSALASLRAPIDAFFDGVMINDPDHGVRARRLNLLARFRDAVHAVADFSKIEG
ncbi:MAG: glycine--tRNA ligase subunit beta [Pseudomonadota bacterium]